jgi:transposase
MKRMMKLEELRLDGGTQTRVRMQQSVVREYAEAMSRGEKFPPVDVFFDGMDYWLVDGFHRYRACEINGTKTIAAKIREGSREDAVLYSLGVNATHGLRRTNADKQNAVRIMLEHPEWSKWSDREIARRCGVGNEMVSRYRRRMNDGSENQQEKTERTTKNCKSDKLVQMKDEHACNVVEHNEKIKSAKLEDFLKDDTLELVEDIVSVKGSNYAEVLFTSMQTYFALKKKMLGDIGWYGRLGKKNSLPGFEFTGGRTKSFTKNCGVQ